MKLQLTKEEIARFKARELKISNLTDENVLVAEFGRLYGYQAIKAVLDDEISRETMNWLIESGRKIVAKENYNLAGAVFTAVASANAKDPLRAFNSNTKEYKKEMKL